MAIKVNGTTVINDSRALSNIASVDATTVASLGAAGVGGGGTIDLTATGAISAGDLVGISSTGGAEVVSPVEGATSILVNSQYNIRGLERLSSTKFIVLYRHNDGYDRLRVGTISGSSISWGTELNTNLSCGYSNIAVDEANSSFCVYFRNDNASYRGYAYAGTVSGTTITKGSNSFVSNQNGQYNHTIVNAGSNKYVSSSSGSPDFHVIVTSGSTISSVNTTYTGGYGIDAVEPRNMQHIGNSIVLYNTGNYYRHFYRIDATGSSPSVSFESGGSNTAWDRLGAYYDTTNNYYVRMGANGSQAAVESWNVSNSNPSNWSKVDEKTLSFTPYEYLTGSFDSGSVGYLTHRGSDQSTINVQSVTLNSSGAIALGTPVATTIPNSVNYSVVVGGKLVIAFYNNDTSLLNFKVINVASAYFSLIGVSESTVSNGQTAKITVVGGENSNVSGLTTGQSYGVNLSGDFEPGYTPKLGVATSATSILLT